MQLVLNEDQEMIAQTARDFLAENSPVARFRALRDSKARSSATPRRLFKEMAGLGWAGIPFDEKQGGAGMGLAELVLDRRGPRPQTRTRALHAAASPWAAAHSSLGEQRRHYVEAWLAGGDRRRRKVVAFAHQEARSRYDVCRRRDASRSIGGDGYQPSRREGPGARRGRSRCGDRIPARTAAGEAGDRDGHHALPRRGGRSRRVRASGQTRVDSSQRRDRFDSTAYDVHRPRPFSGRSRAGRGAARRRSSSARRSCLCGEMLGGMFGGL